MSCWNSLSEGQKGNLRNCPQGQEIGGNFICSGCQWWCNYFFKNSGLQMESSTLYSACYTKIQKRRIIPCVSFLLLHIKCHKHLEMTQICCLIVSEGLVWANLVASRLRVSGGHDPAMGHALVLIWSLGSSSSLIQCCWIHLPAELKSLFPG